MLPSCDANMPFLPPISPNDSLWDALNTSNRFESTILNVKNNCDIIVAKDKEEKSLEQTLNDLRGMSDESEPRLCGMKLNYDFGKSVRLN